MHMVEISLQENGSMLFTAVDFIDSQKKEEDIINSFVTMAEQMDNFWMPTFPEVSGDSRRMNSNHGVASVIDAYRKGVVDFDLEKAFEAAKKGITEKTLAPWSGMPGVSGWNTWWTRAASTQFP